MNFPFVSALIRTGILTLIAERRNAGPKWSADTFRMMKRTERWIRSAAPESINYSVARAPSVRESRRGVVRRLAGFEVGSECIDTILEDIGSMFPADGACQPSNSPSGRLGCAHGTEGVPRTTQQATLTTQV